MNDINFFNGEYNWLSNFWFSDTIIDGKLYKTNEHFYQASKMETEREHDLIRNLTTPALTKKYVYDFPLREDWEEVKDAIMYKGVKAKFFQNMSLAKKLIETGDRQLIEGNTWDDVYWGVCRGQGKNHLGLILMQVRLLLQKQTIV